MWCADTSTSCQSVWFLRGPVIELIGDNKVSHPLEWSWALCCVPDSITRLPSAVLNPSGAANLELIEPFPSLLLSSFAGNSWFSGVGRSHQPIAANSFLILRRLVYDQLWSSF